MCAIGCRFGDSWCFCWCGREHARTRTRVRSLSLTHSLTLTYPQTRQMMAFMVFSLVWVGEIFCILRVRGSPSLAKVRKSPYTKKILNCILSSGFAVTTSKSCVLHKDKISQKSRLLHTASSWLAATCKILNVFGDLL